MARRRRLPPRAAPRSRASSRARYRARRRRPPSAKMARPSSRKGTDGLVAAALAHRDARVLGVVLGVGLRALAQGEARAARVADDSLVAAVVAEAGVHGNGCCLTLAIGPRATRAAAYPSGASSGRRLQRAASSWSPLTCVSRAPPGASSSTSNDLTDEMPRPVAFTNASFA